MKPWKAGAKAPKAHEAGRNCPATAVKYIRRIEELIEAPVAMLSTSPEREDVILVHDPFTD